MAIKAVGFDYLGVVASLSGASIYKTVAAASGNAPIVDQEVLILIDGLRSSGYKVGLLSNLSGRWAGLLYEQKVDQHFDAVVLSNDSGYVKPDPRAFQDLAKALDVRTDELIFIDDRNESLANVEAIGVVPILYSGFDRLREKLSEHGIIIKLALDKSEC